MIQWVKRKGYCSLCLVTAVCPCACFATSHLPKSEENLCCSMYIVQGFARRGSHLWHSDHTACTTWSLPKQVYCYPESCSPSAFSPAVEEFMHLLLHHILLPFSGTIWKGICRKMRLLQNVTHSQSSCDRLLQFCIGPWRECPGVTPRAHWPLQWLLMVAVCSGTHDGCWLVGHLPLKAVSGFSTALLQMELWTVFMKVWHLTSGAQAVESSQKFSLLSFCVQTEIQGILSCWDAQTGQLLPADRILQPQRITTVLNKLLSL